MAPGVAPATSTAMHQICERHCGPACSVTRYPCVGDHVLARCRRPLGTPRIVSHTIRWRSRIRFGTAGRSVQNSPRGLVNFVRTFSVQRAAPRNVGGGPANHAAMPSAMGSRDSIGGVIAPRNAKSRTWAGRVNHRQAFAPSAFLNALVLCHLDFGITVSRSPVSWVNPTTNPKT